MVIVDHIHMVKMIMRTGNEGGIEVLEALHAP